MDAFDRLSSALAVQIVNTLGWKDLRPVQNQSIDAILDGKNCVVLAPTAGGKTEASLFPLLSLMDTEDRAATSVLYIAPIRALLNNQETRLEKLTGLIGRRSFKWHGDVSDSARKRFIRNPTDVLAVTPESLEAMLMSSRVPGKRLLGQVKAVVIDEVHAFAADDRGAHLVAVLERIQRLSGFDIQRIGLSATVGDPEAILAWLSGSSRREGVVINPGGKGVPPDVRLDFVGSLANAAEVIDRLYPGTRRLVFVDSRRRVEALAHQLRLRDVDTFVSHSSLAVSARAAAETAFQERDNCVIVATSALELGIDVGDLDHVIQIDAPSTVSSFLQRMGRTGRRPGTRANCTFLATSDDAVLRAAALIRLWSEGFVEPTEPNRRAAHILAHQLITLGIQNVGVGIADWWGWVRGCAAFADLSQAERDQLFAHMLGEDIVAEVDTHLILGRRGEKLYAGANFRELYAVFSVPPVLKVMHGRREVGSVDAWFAQQDGALAFVLGGRPWDVVHIDWRRGVCYVQPAESAKYPRWMGRPVLLSRALCQSMLAVLTDTEHDDRWSRRATQVVDELRDAYPFLAADEPAPLVSEANRVRWWTFAGGRANNLLAALLTPVLGTKISANNLCVTFSEGAAASDVAIRDGIRGLRGDVTWARARSVAPAAARGRLSKFQPCLPEELELDLLARNLMDVNGANLAVATEPSMVEEFAGAEDVRRAIASADDELLPPGPPPSASPPLQGASAKRQNPVHMVDTAAELEALIPKLIRAKVIGLDVETGDKDRLCLVQVATGDETWIVDPLAVDDIAGLASVFESPRVLKVIHNATFERRILAANGMDLVNVYDTLVASRRKHGHWTMGGHGLDAVCERELGIVLDKSEQRSAWASRPLSESQLAYAALDAEVLVRLHVALSAAADPSEAPDGSKRYRLLGPEGFYWSQTKGLFGGHSGLKHYGRMDCPATKAPLRNGTYQRSRVFFTDEATALSCGYKPCGRCMRERRKEWERGELP